MFYMKLFLTPIAILSIITNFAVIVLFLRNKVWLKRPYNVFILSLSFTDMITGIIMFITPRTIFDEPIKIPANWFFGNLYCKFLWTRWLLFALGAVSVYTCLFLTSERWTAICRPFKYRTRFSSKPLIGYVVLVWFLGLSTSSIGALEATFLSTNHNHTTLPCKITPIAQANWIGFVTIISVSVKFVIPSIIIVVLYSLAILQMRRSVERFPGQSNRNQSLKNVTTMAAVASLVLVLCWLPNQIYFILVKFRLADMFTHFHNASSVVVLLSSTINPFIYGFWGKQFRAGIKSFLSSYIGHGQENTMTPGFGNHGFYTQKNGPMSPNITEDTTM